MKFEYYLPEENETEPSMKKFMPMVAFIVFSGDEDKPEVNPELQDIYTRRLPQVIKMKMDMVSRFNTNFILPLDRSTESPQYLDTIPGSPWTEPEFIGRFERFDYMVQGTLSLKNEYLNIKLYSRLNGDVIFEKDYSGDKDKFFEFSTDFLMDFFSFFEIMLTDKEKELLRTHPSTNPSSIEYMMKALDNDPFNPLETLDNDEYLNSLESAVKEDPKSNDISDILVGYAAKLEAGGEVDKSVEILERLIQTVGHKRNPVMLLSRILMRHNRFDRAFDVLDKAAAANSSETKDIYYLMARENMQTDRKEVTLKLFEKAIEAEPENPDIFDTYGYYLAATDDMPSALNVFTKGLKYSSERETSLLNTAQVYTIMKKYDEARAIYDKLRVLYPQSARSQASRSIFYALNGEKNNALLAITEALNNSPESPVINLTAARVFDFLNDKENAERYARTTIDLNPDKIITDEATYLFSRISAGITEEQQKENRNLFLDGIREMRKNNHSEALEIFSRVVELEPNFWRAWFLKGVTLRITGELEQALDSLSQVDELFPDQTSLHLEVGKCYMGMEQFQEAFPHIRYAFKNRPEEPEIMGNMALVYMYLGRLKEAEILLTQVQKMDPYNKNVEVYIEELERLKKRRKSSRGNGGTDV